MPLCEEMYTFILKIYMKMVYLDMIHFLKPKSIAITNSDIVESALFIVIPLAINIKI